MEYAVAGAALFFNLSPILALCAGTLLGIIIGAIPGLGPVQLIPLSIPFTLFMDPTSALIFLFAEYIASIYGGSISAILLRTPGTPASIATVFDGYPLARSGKAGKALQLALVASVIGDLVSTGVLITVAQTMAEIALKFGPAAIASVVIFSLTMVAGTVGDSLARGLLAACIGAMFALIGTDSITGTPRFTFGITQLQTGIGLLPLIMGLYTISELFVLSEQGMRSKDVATVQRSDARAEDSRVSLKEIWALRGALTRGSVLGVALGILPGLGSSAAALLAYGWAQRASKEPHLFGKGSLEGVAAPEAANNAETSGALLPFLTLGIPGNSVIAILGGAFILHGLVPGPLLFQKSGDVVYSLYYGLVFINLFMLLIGFLVLRYVHYVVYLPLNALFAICFGLSVVGVYAVSTSMFDVWLLICFGFLGYCMHKFSLPIAPLLITFLLVPMLEESLRQALILSRGDVTAFVRDPIAAGFLLLTAGWLLYRTRLHKTFGRAAPS